MHNHLLKSDTILRLNQGWELQLGSKKKQTKTKPTQKTPPKTTLTKPHPLPSKSCLDGTSVEDIKPAVRSKACSITKKRHLWLRPWKADSTLKHLSMLIKLVDGGVAHKDSFKKFCQWRGQKSFTGATLFPVWHKG